MDFFNTQELNVIDELRKRGYRAKREHIGTYVVTFTATDSIYLFGDLASVIEFTNILCKAEGSIAHRELPKTEEVT